MLASLLALLVAVFLFAGAEMIASQREAAIAIVPGHQWTLPYAMDRPAMGNGNPIGCTVRQLSRPKRLNGTYG